MGREFECKYAATAQSLSAMAEEYPIGRRIEMESTYFDTADGALCARRITLRLRRENERTVCTLKTPLPDGSRAEWECSAADIRDGIRALAACGAPIASEIPDADALVAVCGARFTRLAIDVPTADGRAELALDNGFLLGGNRRLALHEVEVECKSGSDAATVAFAEDLAARWQLTPEAKSKFSRAHALAQEDATWQTSEH